MADSTSSSVSEPGARLCSAEPHEPLAHAPVEHRRRQVERDADVDADRLPAVELAHGLLDHPVGDRREQAGALGGGQEQAGADQLAARGPSARAPRRSASRRWRGRRSAGTRARAGRARSRGGAPRRARGRGWGHPSCGRGCAVPAARPWRRTFRRRRGGAAPRPCGRRRGTRSFPPRRRSPPRARRRRTARRSRARSGPRGPRRAGRRRRGTPRTSRISTRNSSPDWRAIMSAERVTACSRAAT